MVYSIMGQTSVDDLEVRPALEAEQFRALWIVLSDYPKDNRPDIIRSVHQQATRRSHRLDGLAVALRQDKIVAAIWADLSAGNTAVLWTPRVCEEADGESDFPLTAVALLSWADQYLRSHDVRLAQVLIKPDQDQSIAYLSAAEYRYLADLLYLECPEERMSRDPPDCDLIFEPYDKSQKVRMAKLVEQTYEQTLDCPAMNGVRPIGEVMEGYELTGDFSPDRWFFVRELDRDVGCLLLTSHSGSDQWELVYMGLVPWARGRGWGIEIVRFAQWQTRRAGRTRLILAVDTENRPAVAMYQAAGMQTVDRRSVFFKPLQEVDAN